ncbi:hypothetical protein [Agromyces larvae]|uniref:Uncharacterized protein n=1 Tax=Agromyces larvae TaxID=2929802 RepID=A0ABY4C3K9_9MICO|nr:hypothetical protein [Agromyces larvae]UOE45904.1 hypothetical protein MTO99_09235 [Agromyces larvae]
MSKPQMTERQAAAWPEAIAAINAVDGVDLPEGIGYWDVIWGEETRPGRGHYLDARYNDGEHFAQITMDVYGYPNTSVAELDWLHASGWEECPCGCNDEEAGE